MINYDWREIGKRVQKERKLAHMSLDKLAEEIGITRQTLSKFEKGDNVNISVEILLKICEKLDFELGYLLGEYSCKTREITDICNSTGLSSLSVEHLIEITHEKKSGSDIAQGEILLINYMLEDFRFLSDASDALRSMLIVSQNRRIRGAKVTALLPNGDALLPNVETGRIGLHGLYAASLQNAIYSFIERVFEEGWKE